MQAFQLSHLRIFDTSFLFICYLLRVTYVFFIIWSIDKNDKNSTIFFFMSMTKIESCMFLIRFFQSWESKVDHPRYMAHFWLKISYSGKKWRKSRNCITFEIHTQKFKISKSKYIRPDYFYSSLSKKWFSNGLNDYFIITMIFFCT